METSTMLPEHHSSQAIASIMSIQGNDSVVNGIVALHEELKLTPKEAMLLANMVFSRATDSSSKKDAEFTYRIQCQSVAFSMFFADNKLPAIAKQVIFEDGSESLYYGADYQIARGDALVDLINQTRINFLQ